MCLNCKDTKFQNTETTQNDTNLTIFMQGDFVNEYVGEIITVDECKRRIEKYHADNFSTFYMLKLDSNRYTHFQVLKPLSAALHRVM